MVRVFDFLEANGTAYIVMELAHGETLASRIETSGRLSPQTIERILYPVLDGLEQVHDVGFLHRDIKPANIILDAMDNPTLIDFGAARVAMAGRTSQMTAIFTAPGYAAREQFTSGKQGAVDRHLPWPRAYIMPRLFCALAKPCSTVVHGAAAAWSRGTPWPSPYVTPRLYWASAKPCSAALRYHDTAAA